MLFRSPPGGVEIDLDDLVVVLYVSSCMTVSKMPYHQDGRLCRVILSD